MQAVLADWRTAPIPDRLRAMLRFVGTLTLRPDEVSPADVAPLRAAGLSDEEIEEAIHVCAVFNIADRMADAFGFAVPPDGEFRRGAGIVLKTGYRLPGF